MPTNHGTGISKVKKKTRSNTESIQARTELIGTTSVQITVGSHCIRLGIRIGIRIRIGIGISIALEQALFDRISWPALSILVLGLLVLEYQYRVSIIVSYLRYLAVFTRDDDLFMFLFPIAE